MKITLVNSIFFLMIVSYLFSTLVCERFQSKGVSYYVSFDRSLFTGVGMFLISSGMVYVAALNGDLPVYNFS